MLPGPAWPLDKATAPRVVGDSAELFHFRRAAAELVRISPVGPVGPIGLYCPARVFAAAPSPRRPRIVPLCPDVEPETVEPETADDAFLSTPVRTASAVTLSPRQLRAASIRSSIASPPPSRARPLLLCKLCTDPRPQCAAVLATLSSGTAVKVKSAPANLKSARAARLGPRTDV